MDADQSLNILVQHYAVFKRTIESNFEQYQARQNVSNGKPSAREKLGKLSKQQFVELSIDVFDELGRRNAGQDPFLPPSQQYHLKRNQARQKLSSLPLNRFKELVADVFFDAERRFPKVVEIMNAKQSEIPSNQVINKNASTDEIPINFASLDNLMADLGSMLNSPTVTNQTNKSAPISAYISPASDSQNPDDLRSKILELENQLKDAQISKPVVPPKNYEELEKKVESLTLSLEKLQKEYTALNDAHKNLQEDYNEQEQNRALNEQNEANVKKIQELQDQLKNKDWERKEEEYLARIRDLEKSLQAKSNPSKDAKSPFVQFSKDSFGSIAIPWEHLEAYSKAVKDLVDSSRTFKAASILMAMKSVVISCKHIVENVEIAEKSVDRDQVDVKELEKCKTNLSTNLSQLMATTKEHATQGKASPLQEKLEQTVSDLNEVVKQICFFVKEIKAGSPINVKSNDLVDLTSKKENNTDIKLLNVKELKSFLESQTDLIVQAIQSLLYTMRQQTPFGEEFKTTIDEIIEIVERVIDTAGLTFDQEDAKHLLSQGNAILDQLGDSTTKMDELGSAMLQTPNSKQARQRLASCSYEIAKYVKELISLVE